MKSGWKKKILSLFIAVVLCAEAVGGTGMVYAQAGSKSRTEPTAPEETTTLGEPAAPEETTTLGEPAVPEETATPEETAVPEEATTLEETTAPEETKVSDTIVKPEENGFLHKLPLKVEVNPIDKKLQVQKKLTLPDSSNISELTVSIYQEDTSFQLGVTAEADMKGDAYIYGDALLDKINAKLSAEGKEEIELGALTAAQAVDAMSLAADIIAGDPSLQAGPYVSHTFAINKAGNVNGKAAGDLVKRIQTASNSAIRIMIDGVQLKAGTYSVTDQDAYYEVTISMDNEFLWALSSEPFGYEVSLELNITSKADTVYDIAENGNELSFNITGAVESGDPDEPDPGADQYIIKKKTQSRSNDDFKLTYEIEVGSEKGLLTLDGKTIYDAGPGYGTVNEDKFKLVSAKNGSMDLPVSGTGPFQYTFPEGTGKDTQVITLSYEMTGEAIKQYITDNKIDISFTNKVSLTDPADGDKELASSVTKADKVISTFMTKEYTVNSKNPQLLDWTIKVNTKFSHLTGAYLIDWLSENQEYAGPVTVTSAGGTDSPALDGAGTGISGEYADLGYTDVQGFSDLSLLYHEKNGEKAYGFALPLGEINSDSNMSTGGAYTIQYTTKLVYGSDNSQVTGGTSENIANHAKIVYNHMCVGTIGPGEAYTADIGIEKEGTINYNAFTKAYKSYHANTQTITWEFDINRYGVAYDYMIIKDTVSEGQELTGKCQAHEDIDVQIMPRESGAVSTGQLSFLGASEPDGTAQGYSVVGKTIYFCLKNISADSYYTISFQTKITDGSFLAGENKKRFENRASVILKPQGLEKLPEGQEKSVNPELANALLNKEKVGSYDYEKNTTKWKLTVNPNTIPIKGLTVADSLPEGTTFCSIDSIEIYKSGQIEVKEMAVIDNHAQTATSPSGEEISWVSAVGESAGGFSLDTLTFSFNGSAVSGSKYVITFTLDTDEDYRMARMGKGKVELINQAVMTGSVYEADIHLSKSAKFEPNYNRITKNGEKTGGSDSDIISWSVQFNKDQVDLGGRILADDLTEDALKSYLELSVEDKVAVYEAAVNPSTGALTKKNDMNLADTPAFLDAFDLDYGGFRFTVPESWGKTPLILEFKTHIIRNAPAGAIKNKLYLYADSGSTASETVTESNAIGAAFDYDSFAGLSPKPKVNITKTNETGTLKLSGAEFQAVFQIGTKTMAKSRVSNAKGIAAFTNLPNDKLITITETKAPNTYITDGGEYHFVFLKDKAQGDFSGEPCYEDITFITGSVGEVTVKNYASGTLRPIQLIKTYQDKNLKTMAEEERNSLFNATVFTLYTGSACAETDKKADAKPFWKEGKAQVEFDTGLELNQTYYLKETAAPADYDVNSTVYVCRVNGDGSISYKLSGLPDDKFSQTFPACENKKSVPVGPVKLSKAYEGLDLAAMGQEEREALLGNTVFTLFQDSSCTQEAARKNLVWQEGMALAVFDSGLGLNETYYLKETAVPAGYDINETVYVCRINGQGSVSYKLLNHPDHTFSLKIPVCTNKKTVYAKPVKLIKSYEDTVLAAISELERDNLLHATVFTLYSDSTCTEAVRVAAASPVWAEGKAMVTFDSGLELNRTYYLKETAAPAGYDINTTVYVCRVNEEGVVSYRLSGQPDAACSTEFPVCENKKTVYARPIHLIKTYRGLSLASLTEADRNKYLEATIFTLYTDPACLTVFDLAKPHWTGSHAVVTYDRNLEPDTTYYLKETAAPGSYRVNTAVYVCKIDEAGNVSYRLAGQAEFKTEFPVCENQKRSGSSGGSGGGGGSQGSSQVTIITKPGNQAPPADSLITKLPSGTTVVIETDGKGNIRTEGLPPGSYELEQQIADKEDLNNPFFTNPVFKVIIEEQEGRLVAKDKNGNIFDLNKQDLTAYIKKSHIKGVVKTDKGEVLTGTILGIFRQDETVFDEAHLLNGQTAVTDENGYFVFENIPYGTYKVVEMSVPHGYAVLGDTGQSIKVNRHAFMITMGEDGQAIEFIHVDDEAIPLAAATGDRMKPAVWLILMSASAALAAAVRKKKQNKAE